MSGPSDEQLIQALKMQLGIAPADAAEARRAWEELVRRDRRSPDRLCNELARLMEKVFEARLRPGATLTGDVQILHELWVKFTNWLDTRDGKGYQPRLMGVLKNVLRRGGALGSGSPPIRRGPPPTGTLSPPPAGGRNVAAASAQTVRDRAHSTPQQPQQEAPVAAPVPQWKNQPVPNEPDRHDEHYAQALDAPDGLKLLGARVRGKKHKHEGTNCDDWFEFAVSGPWTLLAVADGAGGKKLSRVGAKASTKAAIGSLADALKDHRVVERASWETDLKRDGPGGAFAARDLEVVQEALHEAMRAAHRAVQQAADERAGKSEYEALLGCPLTLSDLSATLLLAVHTTVRHQDQDHSFVLACQIGDGMVAAIDAAYRLTLLGKADSGDYGGETEFLTSLKKLEPEHLRSKTYVLLSRPLRALLVMTDGVADDYFPNDPGMLRLHADLVLNQILDVGAVTEESVAEALKQTALPNMDTVRAVRFHTEVDLVTDGHAQRVNVAGVEAYAQELGLPLESVAGSAPLLLAGSRARLLCAALELPERLRVWLDSYQVRGSFDDRTLVILYREAQS